MLYAISTSTNLFACWHPLAYAHDLNETPLAGKLLDRHLVIWRDSNRALYVMDDLCIHRGTALSLGEIKGDETMCPNHRWRHDASGVCTLIPQSRFDNIPAKARVQDFRGVERYGLVWVALAEPLHPLPDIPVPESSDWKIVNTGPFAWNSDASRQLENFTEFGHFPGRCRRTISPCNGSVPLLLQLLTRLFNSQLPDCQHVFVRSLIQTTKISITQ